MPVNYLSRPSETTPYVLPVSLELLSRVNSYKQSQFYQNASKVNNMLGELNNIDIANPTQKKYLDEATNSVVSKINNSGALDYSDMNVANSIENLGSEIYKDDTIMNGIASTKKVRQIQANYQKMANDPKLNKFYNPIYEAYDYDNYIKPYVNSDNVQASYDGPTNPTIFTGNPLLKAADLIKKALPNITIDTKSGDGGYIDTKTTTKYTPEALAATFDSLLDPSLKKELHMQAWGTYDYQYRNADGTSKLGVEDYVNNLNQQTQTHLDTLTDAYNVQKQRILNSAGDAATMQDAKDKAYNLQQQIERLNTSRKQNEQAFRNTFAKDKGMAFDQLYMNGLRQDLYSVFGAEQTKVARQANLKELEYNKLRIAALNKGFQFNGFNPDGTLNLTPMDANGKSKASANVLSTFESTQPNTKTTAQKEADAVTIDHLATSNQTLYDNTSKALWQVLYNAAAKDKDNIDPATGKHVPGLWDAMGFDVNYTTDKNSSDYTGSSKLLNSIAALSKTTSNLTIGKDNLDIEDIQAALQNDKKIGLNPQAYTFLQGVVKNYNDIMNHADNDKPIPQDMRNFMQTYNSNMGLVKAQNDLVESAKNQILNESKTKLSSKENDILTGYINNPDAKDANGKYLYKSWSSGSSAGISPTTNISVNSNGGYSPNYEISQLLHRVGITNISGEINKRLANAGDLNNYQAIYFSNAENESKLKNIIPGMNTWILGENKDNLNGEKVQADNINGIKVYKDDTGWKLAYSVNVDGKIQFSDPTGSGKYKLTDLPLSPKAAEQIGLMSVPDQVFEKTANINGIKGTQKNYQTPNFYNLKSDGSIADHPKDTKLMVYTTVNSRNDKIWGVKVYSPTTGKWVSIPYTPQDEARFGVTANGAYLYGTMRLDTYSNTNLPGFGTTAKDKTGNTVIVKNVDDFINKLPDL